MAKGSIDEWSVASFVFLFVAHRKPAGDAVWLIAYPTLAADGRHGGFQPAAPVLRDSDLPL
jgi:hypothetical protein